MSEFISDEQRDDHIGALIEEHRMLRERGSDRAKVVAGELKRLGVKEDATAPPAAPVAESDGEFGSGELRVAHIEGLKDELRAAVGDRKKAIEAELKRLAGKPAKTQAELDAVAAEESKQSEEPKLNPGVAS